jgi:hypothetical protein
MQIKNGPTYSLACTSAFGPGLWECYGGVVFPAIADAILTHDETVIQDAVDTTTKAIMKVTKLMGTKI